MKLLLFFVDGLGLGRDDVSNPARGLLDGIADFPLTADSAPRDFPEGLLLPIDVCGGVKGLPQSATGQCSLMTGTNAPALLGYHLSALPNQILVNLIKEKGMMKTLMENGIRATSSNLYTKEFFNYRENLERKRGKNMFPVSTLTIRHSGAAFRLPADYHDGQAIFTDLTNRFLQKRDIPLISPEEAAQRMVRILEDSDFVFHEYFATDSYAHKKRFDDLNRALKEINIFLKVLKGLIDPDNTAILLISDHGNCEDMSSADHNRNTVPLLLLSCNDEAHRAFAGIENLHEVKKGVLKFFGIDD